ncbi:hypothetical protein [Streptomyces sp. ME02-8801-2C]|uniref:hypothetical protein n=1 Tax=Streptomyces sp. ME02-8801-2C TaxID=3028680 RepID=UPI0039F69955
MWASEGLSQRDRSLITVATLVALHRAEGPIPATALSSLVATRKENENEEA